MVIASNNLPKPPPSPPLFQHPTTPQHQTKGESYRDALARAALQGFCANPSFALINTSGFSECDDWIGRACYLMADAVLKERGNKQ